SVHAPRPKVPTNSRSSAPPTRSSTVLSVLGRPIPYSCHGPSPILRNTPPCPATSTTSVPVEVSTAICWNKAASGSKPSPSESLFQTLVATALASASNTLVWPALGENQTSPAASSTNTRCQSFGSTAMS